MSALRQKQTSRHLQPMSALPPKADIGTQSWNVRFWHKADICGAANGPLFDYLICAGQQALRYREANIVRRTLVDDQFEHGGLLDRQFTWRRGMQKLGDESSQLSICFVDV